MRKICKWAGVSLGALLSLVILLFLLFYFPPFQNWAVRQVSAYASEQTGMTIRVGHVHLRFPLDLSLEQVEALQPNDSLPGVTDTVACVGSVVADVQLWPLLKKQVMVDELSFRKMTVNTADFVHTMRIKGHVGRLDVQAHGIDIGRELVKVDHVGLYDSQLDLALSDTVPKDTTPSENFWKIAISNLKIQHTDFDLHLPGDTLSVKAYLGDVKAQQAYLDLEKSAYTVRHLDWKNGTLRYDQNFEPRINGFDANHLALTGLALVADSFSYSDDGLGVKIREAQFNEKCGLAVSSLRGSFTMDSTRLALPHLRLRTPGSDLLVDYAMDMNAFADHNPGKLSVTLHGHVGRQDLMTFVGPSLPKALMRRWPNAPVIVDGMVRGNMQKMHLEDVRLAMPGAFRLRTSGFLSHLDDTDHLKADLNLSANTYNLNFLTAMLDKSITRTLRIPSGIGLRGHLLMNGTRYAATFTATQGGGSLRGLAAIDTKKMAYNARLTASRLPLQHFLRGMSLHPFTGDIDLSGAGTDLLSPRTSLQATAHIRRFQYATYNLDHIDAKASVRRGKIHANIHSLNQLFQGLISFDGYTANRRLHAAVQGDFHQLDLYRLGLTDAPLTVSASAHIDLASDLKQYYQAKGTIGDLVLRDSAQTYHPEDVKLDVLTRRDTTHAVVGCGDFQLDLDGHGGYAHLLNRCNRLMAEVQSQLKHKQIDQLRLRHFLPEARIYLSSGRENIVSRALRHYGYDLASVFVDMTSSPIGGINGQLQVDSLVVDSFQVDTVRARFVSDKQNMTYAIHVQNGKNNPNYIFNAFLDGGLNERGAYAKTRVYDWKDSLGIRLALQASMEQHGLSFHIYEDNPVLAYKTFSVNDSNYVYLGDDRRVSADMKLRAADGMGIQIATNDANTDALQDVTLTLHQFDLGDALAMIPFTPDVTGILDGDFHLVQTQENLTLSSTVNVDNMVYEGSVMGNVGTEFTYMPKSDGSHYVDGILTRNGDEVGTLTGTYRSAGEGFLDATLGLERMPMDLVNGFIPDHLIGFRGAAEGELTIKGTLSKPDVNGEVFLDSTYMFSEPYGVEVRFANDPVTIKNSRLLFENFDMYAHNDSPLTLAGYFDFSDMDHMKMNARMMARNYLLVDAKETARSEAYGKAYVNFFGGIQGELDNLNMRGRLEVLGTTDLNYNLKDSPLSTDNQLEGLVEFVDLNDTTTDVVSRPPLTGFNMDLSVNIDEGAHIDCFLNADHSNYVDIIGGGDLRLQYNPADNIVLRGRYTIGSGEMKYALPVIPLKTFTIQDGSYIEFTGDPMNPRLNITASETTKSTVGSGSGEGRSVEFTCGVVVTKTLNDMGLEFTIDAPEDMTIHNQLQSMSKEDRGKLAVTMLTTGMYLADGNTSNFTMNSALSAFLNSQINQISGKALRSLDVTFGVDNSFGSNGTLHTDYNFKFAKRFWNNRLRIVIGGKLSSGEDVQASDETFFDNVTFEYRLSDTSNKYLNLFYQRDSYDWLEGNVSKFGGGFLWKRKLRHFKDLFRFKDDDENVPPDSARNSSAKGSTSPVGTSVVTRPAGAQ